MHVTEAGALQIIGDKLDLPVPRMLDHTTNDGLLSIEMDFVEGKTLLEEWSGLSTEQKLDIAKQLREILTAIRSLEPGPEGKGISSSVGGPARDLRIYSCFEGGPFPTEAAFNDWLVAETYRSTPSNVVAAFREQMRDDHRIVFAHGDLGQQNIIIRDGKVVALVDWEYAGWFPEYWDFIKFFTRGSSAKDWCEYAHVIFPETYFEQLFMYQFLHRFQSPCVSNFLHSTSD